MSTITAASITVRSPDELDDAFDRAFSVFSGRRPRPVHIQIPTDVLAMDAPAPRRAPTPAAAESLSLPVDAAEADRAARLLRTAERPFIIVGGGARDCGPQICELADRTNALIGCTIGGKSVVPSDHPRCAGATLTFSPVSSELLDADVVLAVGTEFSELDYWALPSDWSLRGRLIRIDIDGEQIGRTFTPDIALVADAGAALTALLESVPPRGNTGADRTAPRRRDLALDSSLTPHLPLIDALDRALPRDRVVSGDSTQPAYAANHLLPVHQPRAWLMPIGYGALGSALPMAIGAKIGDRKAPVIALVGDAGLLFSVAELATAVDHRLGIPIVVWNNRGYGEIRDAMDHAGIAHIGTDITTHDVLMLARGFGCHAELARSTGELGRQVGAALDRDLPTVIEVRSDQFRTVP